MEEKIVQWVKYDDKIREYNDKNKLLKAEKDKLGVSIMETLEIDDTKSNKEMPQFKIESLNTRVLCHQSNNYEGLTNKFLSECFHEYFNSEEKSKEILQFIKNKRQINKKISLKREYLMN